MTILTDEIKEKIKDYIATIDIDPESLSSYYYDSNPFAVEDHLIGSSGCGCWDDDEEYEAQVQKLIDWLENESIIDHINIDLDFSDDDEEYEEKLAKFDSEIVDWLETLI